MAGGASSALLTAGEQGFRSGDAPVVNRVAITLECTEVR